MNTHHCIARLLVLVVASVFTVCRAEDKPKPPAAKPPATQPPSEAQLRAVATKGLGFLATAGDQWMEDKSCNGCPHMPLLLWSHREAKRRGFTVEQKNSPSGSSGRSRARRPRSPDSRKPPS